MHQMPFVGGSDEAMMFATSVLWVGMDGGIGAARGRGGPL